MAKRDFLAVTDLTRDEVLRLFDLAGRMKAGSYRDTPLAGKTLAMIFAKANERMENIGARRLHTVMTTLLEDVLFDLPELAEKRIMFDADKVRARLGKIVDDEDLRRYIL